MWEFNAWGGDVLPSWESDRRIGRFVAGLAGARVPASMDYTRKVILEGGAIDVDGEGTLIATEESVLDANRWCSKDEGREGRRGAVESAVVASLGVEKVVWLPWGVAGDVDTNGHVDNMCRFVGVGEVVLRESLGRK